ncbi:MAG: hypothetical protein MHM6MM_005793 [Cercozoa sp. M6MM]
MPATTQKLGNRLIVTGVTAEEYSETPFEVQGELKMSVFIEGAKGGVVKVNGKVNNVSISGSQQVGVLFETAVASCELVNCKKVSVQTTGTVPTIQIDKSTGTKLYLSAETAEGVTIYSSGSSETNVFAPKGDEMSESPLPEQFTSTFHNGVLTHAVAEASE